MTMLATETPQALYRFFNADGDLLYVGLTFNPAARMAQHRHDKPWWSEVATMSLESFSTRAEVERAERTAIRFERPRYNVTHAPALKPLPPATVEDAGDYLGSAEIAALFSISRQRVYQLTSRPDFPAPMVRLKAGAVWRTADVVAWAEEKGREIHE